MYKLKPVFGESVWADLLYKNIKASKNKLIVVPDFRFLVEFQNHKDLEIITVLVKDKRELPLEGHASDVELYQAGFKFDYTIINTGTLNDLQIKVEKLI